MDRTDHRIDCISNPHSPRSNILHGLLNQGRQPLGCLLLISCTWGKRNVVFLQRYILFSAYTNFGGDSCGCLRQRLMACVGFVACRGWLSLQVREIIGNFLGIFPKSLYLCNVNQNKQRLSDTTTVKAIAIKNGESSEVTTKLFSKGTDDEPGGSDH